MAGSAVARGVRLERAKGDVDETLDSRLRSQILGGSDGVDAEFGQLAGRCVVSHAAGLSGVGYESLDEVLELTLGLGDVFAAVDQGCEFGLMVVACLVDVESVGGEDRFESFTGCGRSVADLDEVVDVGVDVTLMPSVKDGLHVGEVFVEGGAAYAGLLGYLRHGHRPEPLLGDES